MHGDRLVAIREERDASDEEKKIGFVNGGVMALAGDDRARKSSTRSRDKNDQKEFYLTDAVEIANALGLKVVAVEIAAEEVFGINDRAQLAEAERAVPGAPAHRGDARAARRSSRRRPSSSPTTPCSAATS